MHNTKEKKRGGKRRESRREKECFLSKRGPLDKKEFLKGGEKKKNKGGRMGRGYYKCRKDHLRPTFFLWGNKGLHSMFGQKPFFLYHEKEKTSSLKGGIFFPGSVCCTHEFRVETCGYVVFIPSPLC